MTRENRDLLVGLDIGTSKVVTIVAEMHGDGQYEVVGIGQHESRGLKKGVVVDIEKTVAELKAKGVEFTKPVEDHGYGFVTFFKVPGDFEVQLYQPKYTK